MTDDMKRLASEIVGLVRAKTVSGAQVHTTEECANEVWTLLHRYVCVPRRCTQEMIEAHMGVCAGDADEAGPERIKECWQAMVDAVIGEG